MKYKIVTEASVDMSPEFIKENDITVLPIEVNFNGDLYPEGLPNDQFYEKLKQGIIPKTSQPNQFKFETALTPYANKEDWFVFTIVISSNLAGTISQAKNAVESLSMKNVYICDSQVTTFAEGALITEFVKWLKANPNCTPEEATQKLEDLKSRVKLVAIIGDLKYLKQGGRLSTVKFIAASVLGIRPIINLDGGKVTTAGTFRGEYANKFLLECASKRNKDYPLYFGHSANIGLLEKFINKYSAELGTTFDEANIFDIGCVVGTHVGPNCYGFAYFE
ncbi:MAG: DegV family protein [Clostridia bacterium]|nr:DegV family protein [Clostridia bacterium]